MKNVFLLSIGGWFSFGCFAQNPVLVKPRAAHTAAQEKAAGFRKTYNYSAAVRYDLAALAEAEKSGRQLPKAVNDLANDYIEWGRVSLGEELLDKHKEISVGKATAEALRWHHLKGQCRFKQMQYNDALAHHRKAAALAEATGDSVQLYRMKNLLARTYVFQFKMDSVRLAYEALDYFEKVRDYINAGYAALTVNLAFHSSFNLAKAKEYADRALTYGRRGNDLAVEAEAWSRRGEASFLQKRYGEAEADLKNAYAFYQTHAWEPGTVLVNIQLAKLYTETGRLYAAKERFAAAEDINSRLSLPPLTVMIKGFKALYHLKLKDYKAVDSLVPSAIALTAKTADPQMLKGVFAKINEGGSVSMNEVKRIDTAANPLLAKMVEPSATSRDSAYQRMLRLNQMTGTDTAADRGFLNTNNRLLSKMETQYKTRIIADSLKLQKQQTSLAKAELQTRNAVIAGGAAVLVLLCGGIWLQTKNRRRAERDKARIEMLQSEIHHRVKNNLAVINRLVDVAGRKSVGDATLDGLKTRIKSIELLHRHLYSEEARAGNIALQPYFDDLCTAVAATFATAKDIRIRVSADGEVDSTVAEKLGLIVNELVTNSFKYAFSDRSEGSIEVKASRTGGTLNLLVRDNGAGMPGAKANGSYGMKLIKGLSHELNGKFSFQNNDGTQFTLAIPA